MRGAAAIVRTKSPARPMGGGVTAWRIALIVLVVWSLVVIGIRFAEPILDGDLFWHLKYAEQMIARGTLVPDHTLYSWTPASNATIYCTWLADFVLYGLYRAGGLAVLFGFRYVCIAFCAALLLWFARARGVRAPLPALAIIVLSLLGSRAGTIIKPELLSLVAFHLLVFSYATARNADRNNGDAAPWFFAMPAIVAVWVNVHGEFIFAAPFFVAVFLAEMTALWLAPAQALSRRAGFAMLVAFVLSAVAILLTPYGWRYPAQLIADYLLHHGPRVGEAWNNAYQSVLSGGFSELAIDGLLIAGLTAGLVLAAQRRLWQTDWGLLLALLFYVPLFLLFARTTFYLAVVFGYAALDLLAIAGTKPSDRPTGLPARASPLRSAVSAGAAVVLVTTGSIALYSARIADKGSWIGFGISYINPVVEAEFLAASKLGPRLYNIFNSGGYLLWRLDPAYKVMIDPRFFPYKDWFAELYAFSTGESFDAFLQKYPADTAIIDLDRPQVWKSFLQSKEWRLVFYGPTSAVFVDRTIADDRFPQSYAPGRFDHLRNGRTALNVFDLALVVGDYARAWKALDEAEGFAYQIDIHTLQNAIAVRNGYRELAASNYDAALSQFTAAKSRPVQGWREPVILKLLEERVAAAANENGGAIGRYDAALRELTVPVGR